MTEKAGKRNTVASLAKLFIEKEANAPRFNDKELLRKSLSEI